MYVFLLVLAAILFLALKRRETFVVKYGNPFNEDEDLISFDPDAKGTRIFGTTPDTCPANKPQIDAGLCYEECELGYHGVGPVCWADTDRGKAGTIPFLLSCRESGYDGWKDIWPLCIKPIDLSSAGGFFKSLFSTIFEVQIRGMRQSCGGDDMVSGLCYRKCPPNLPKRVPAMPYLCYKGTRGLSYGRGVGEVPPLFAFGE